MVEFLIQKLVIGNKAKGVTDCAFVRWIVFENGSEGNCMAEDLLVNDWAEPKVTLSNQRSVPGRRYRGRIKPLCYRFNDTMADQKNVKKCW